jgi:hypothetical protein
MSFDSKDCHRDDLTIPETSEPDNVHNDSEFMLGKNKNCGV